MSTVQGSLFGCLDEGFLLFNIAQPPAVDVEGVAGVVVLGDDQFGYKG